MKRLFYSIKDDRIITEDDYLTVEKECPECGSLHSTMVYLNKEGMGYAFHEGLILELFSGNEPLCCVWDNINVISKYISLRTNIRLSVIDRTISDLMHISKPALLKLLLKELQLLLTSSYSTNWIAFWGVSSRNGKPIRLKIPTKEGNRIKYSGNYIAFPDSYTVCKALQILNPLITEIFHDKQEG